MKNLTKIKIAHFITDDKFPDSAYEAFEEVLPGGNDFFITKNTTELKYIKKIKPIPVGKYSFGNRNFVKSLKSYDLVVLHGLTAYNCELIVRADRNIRFIWLGLGYDYCDLVFTNYTDMLKEQTIQYYNSIYKNNTIRNHLLKIKKYLAKKFIYRNLANKKEIIKRIDFFAPVVEDEYFRIDKLYPGLLNDYVDWNYGVAAKLVDGELPFENTNGNNILLGSNASITNNHLDAFKDLLNLNLPSDIKIICPLNYGDLSYRDHIVEKGTQLFGESFFPIKDFMAYNEYMHLVSSCSNVIMNHKRQQAGGNIASALYMGSRVFLDPSNPFFEYYKRRGTVINTIDELVSCPELLRKPLNRIEIDNNKVILKQTRGWSAAIKQTEMLIKHCTRDI